MTGSAKNYAGTAGGWVHGTMLAGWRDSRTPSGASYILEFHSFCHLYWYPGIKLAEKVVTPYGIHQPGLPVPILGSCFLKFRKFSENK